MEKEFITVELALRLKVLGFNEPCFGYYNSNGEFKTKQDEYELYLICNSKWISPSCSAPTFSQAFRWFREKYNLVHTVYSNASGYIWELHYNKERGGTHICDSGESGDCEMSGMFTTYEKAEISCLTKLIEIVENEKML